MPFHLQVLHLHAPRALQPYVCDQWCAGKRLTTSFGVGRRVPCLAVFANLYSLHAGFQATNSLITALQSPDNVTVDLGEPGQSGPSTPVALI